MISRIVARMLAALDAICSATMVASGGPRMNTASSTSDSHANAVRSSGEPCNCADQRARTSGPTLGCAAPATNASGKIGQVSVVNSVTTMIAAIAGTCTASCSRTIRRCPKESMSREIGGPMTAADSA